jgi:hypothetical protein
MERIASAVTSYMFLGQTCILAVLSWALDRMGGGAGVECETAVSSFQLKESLTVGS